jgi:hypothetical protein
MEYKADLDLAYVVVDPETGMLPPKKSDSAILTNILRYGFLRIDFISSKIRTQNQKITIFKKSNLNCDIFD